jgi:catechol 2,3-dioxygenase-like lactoylglutathione lyase family enzyme
MAQGLFPDLQLHHAAINVDDIEKAIAFWHDLFGFEVDHRAEIPQIKARIAFVRRGDFRIELFQVEGSAPVPEERLAPNTDLRTQGTKHICFSVEDVQGALEKLHERGVAIAGIMRDFKSAMRQEDDPRLSGDKKPAAAFFFRDPSGTLVEILRRSDFKS